ncbi:MAG: hypothetical protein WD491_13970 [Balneolales bacterium]
MNTKIKVVLAFGTLFLMGFASGFFMNNTVSSADGGYSEERREQADGGKRNSHQLNQENGEKRGDRIFNMLTNELDLTNEQQNSFTEHLSEYKSTIHSTVKEMRDHQHELIIQHYEALREDLSQLLTAEQLEELDSHLHPDAVLERWSNGAKSGRPGS